MEDLNIVFVGEAGQGLQTIERGLTSITHRANYYTFATKEYMSRVRGGINSTSIRIASQKIAAIKERIDILFVLSPNITSQISTRIANHTVVFYRHNIAAFAAAKQAIDLTDKIKSLGGEIYLSSLVTGIILGILAVSDNLFNDYIKELFDQKAVSEILQKNLQAINQGWQYGRELANSKLVNCLVKPNQEVSIQRLLNGSEAVALGALAGGCNFISAYPMSPSTGVLNQLAAYSKKFDIVVEQAEDEIAAINMALGAWYAGAKAIVTTSGGGFALMCESLSLAGMTETPVVISLSQRPGPATGLPTRTEQADLNLALYAGHGEFPRIIFAPGTTEQAFYLTQQAFYLADKYQIPVIILTDQYLVDSYAVTKRLQPELFFKDAINIIKTPKDYQRYQLSDAIISPRGIPDFGDALVCVDSDEHTTAGLITEDFSLRVAMVNKRLDKFKLLQNEVIAPEFYGKEDYQLLVVCWGSNYSVVKEALAKINRTDIALLHFAQVYPLSPSAKNYLQKAKKVVVLENNATGQFAKLLSQELKVEIHHHILKYNGLPFTVEEVCRELNKL